MEIEDGINCIKCSAVLSKLSAYLIDSIGDNSRKTKKQLSELYGESLYRLYMLQDELINLSIAKKLINKLDKTNEL